MARASNSSNFRHRGLKVVVDTTEQAEFDFASRQVPESVQERIASRLIAMPRSPQDKEMGAIRLRELEGWEVAFVLALDGRELVCLVIGIELPGEMERALDYIVRSGMASLPESLQELLKGRRNRR